MLPSSLMATPISANTASLVIFFHKMETTSVAYLCWRMESALRTFSSQVSVNSATSFSFSCSWSTASSAIVEQDPGPPGLFGSTEICRPSSEDAPERGFCHVSRWRENGQDGNEGVCVHSQSQLSQVVGLPLCDLCTNPGLHISVGT